MGGNLLYSQQNDEILKKVHKNLLKAETDTAKIQRFLDLGYHHINLSRDLRNSKSADSAVYYINKALKRSIRIKYKKGIGDSYNCFSHHYKIKGDNNTAEKYSLKALDLFLKEKDKKGIGDSYMTLMYSKENIRDFTETILIGQKARKAFMEAGNKSQQAQMDYDISYFMLGIGRVEESLVLLEECVSLYRELKNEEIQHIYSTLCIVNSQLGKNGKAIEYAQKAISIVEKYKDTSARAAEVYNYSGIAYLAVKDHKKALLYFKNAYSISKNYYDIGMTSLLLTNIIEILMKSKKISEAGIYIKELKRNYPKLPPSDQFEPISTLIKYYVHLKKFDIASGYVQKAVVASDTIQADDMRQIGLYVGIINYNFHTKKYDIARKYINKYKRLCEHAKSPKRLMEIHHMLFRVDSAENKFNSAMENYRLENVYKDSLLNEAKNKEIAELEIRYETSKKEKALKQNQEKNRLLNLKSSLQKTQLEQANLVKNISLGGFILFLIVFLSLYSSYRIKQKTNRILESQKNEINQQNMTLQKLVTEKEWLLKEIHHRVKNNLQMVMSLLNAQSFYLKDDVAMNAIRESQHRIHSMSLIHKKLYQSENVVSIDMKNYIQELIEYFRTTFDTGQRIQFVTDIDPIELYSAQAVPLGLILNEVMTNSLKHAFPNNDNGIISIRFKHSENNQLLLNVSDNGIGILDELQEKHFQSLGMKLIKGFSEDLDAKLNIENDNGLSITISFLHNEKFTDQ